MSEEYLRDVARLLIRHDYLRDALLLLKSGGPLPVEPPAPAHRIITQAYLKLYPQQEKSLRTIESQMQEGLRQVFMLVENARLKIDPVTIQCLDRLDLHPCPCGATMSHLKDDRPSHRLTCYQCGAPIR